ncbi:phage/plasmid replication protein, II/X family [Dechloromonas sp. ZS-1]|uniref:phage/plasmid replication protein, II/X family n=1 Tax=Dechloromonas sp. ZS-1 TaxID=3138067 RepID=UPI0031FCCA8B
MNNKQKTCLSGLYINGVFASSTFDNVKAKFKVSHQALGKPLPYDNDKPTMTSSQVFNSIGNASLTVRSSGDGTTLTIDGSYIKWLTGQNVIGTSDLFYLCSQTFQRVCKAIGICPSQEEVDAVEQGEFVLFRLDYAVHCDAKSEDSAIFLQEQIKKHWAFKQRDYSHYGYHETLYVAQSSKRRTFKSYMKGRDIKAKGGLADVLYGKEIESISNQLVRIELTLRNKYLKETNSTRNPDLKLNNPLAWKKKYAKALLKQRIKTLLSGINGMNSLPNHSKSKGKMSNADKAVIAAHSAGVSISSIYDQRGYKRIRNKIKKNTGIDIALPVGQQHINDYFLEARQLLRDGIKYRSNRALFNAMMAHVDNADSNLTSDISDLMG